MTFQSGAAISISSLSLNDGITISLPSFTTNDPLLEGSVHWSIENNFYKGDALIDIIYPPTPFGTGGPTFTTHIEDYWRWEWGEGDERTQVPITDLDDILRWTASVSYMEADWMSYSDSVPQLEFNSIPYASDVNPDLYFPEKRVLNENELTTISIVDPSYEMRSPLQNWSEEDPNGLWKVESGVFSLLRPLNFEKQSSFAINPSQTNAGSNLTFIFNILDVNETPTDLSISASSFDENIPDASVVATLSSTDPDAGDTFTYSLAEGDGDTDNSAFTIDGDNLKINASPDYETQESYSVRLRTTDSGGLTFEKSFSLSVNDLEEGPLDEDDDGFVDEITNYQIWTESGGVDLTNRRGRTYSDETSRQWDAIKAVEVDSGFSILLEGDRQREGYYRIVSARDNGVISGATRWMNERQMFRSGYEEVFDIDFNDDGVIDFL